MTSSESPRPEPRERIASAFTVVESIVYISLGLLLTGIAFTLLVTSFISFGRIVVSGPVKFSFVELLDQILLILLIVGLLYTVQVSLRSRALGPEPFLAPLPAITSPPSTGVTVQRLPARSRPRATARSSSVAATRMRPATGHLSPTSP